MADSCSPICHAVVLRRAEPDERMAHFYSLMIERDLFGTARLVRNWGRIGTLGRERAEEYETEFEARTALEALARAKRRRVYRDLQAAIHCPGSGSPRHLAGAFVVLRGGSRRDLMAFPPRPPHTRIVRYWSQQRLLQVTCFPLAAMMLPPVPIGRYARLAPAVLRRSLDRRLCSCSGAC
jgi:predicted DNA-binding WGR domain protein